MLYTSGSTEIIQTRTILKPHKFGVCCYCHIWYADAKYSFSSAAIVKIFEFHKSKMEDGGHFENRYIILSLQPFD